MSAGVGERSQMTAVVPLLLHCESGRPSGWCFNGTGVDDDNVNCEKAVLNFSLALSQCSTWMFGCLVIVGPPLLAIL